MTSCLKGVKFCSKKRENESPKWERSFWNVPSVKCLQTPETRGDAPASSGASCRTIFQYVHLKRTSLNSIRKLPEELLCQFVSQVQTPLVRPTLGPNTQRQVVPIDSFEYTIVEDCRQAPGSNDCGLCLLTNLAGHLAHGVEQDT